MGAKRAGAKPQPTVCVTTYDHKHGSFQDKPRVMGAKGLIHILELVLGTGKWIGIAPDFMGVLI
jgi:hypothetical protein